MRGGKQLWEIAVKRNSLATSLVLLSSVLVVDSLMVDQRQLKHFRLRAHQPPREQGNSQHQTAAGPESQQQQQQQQELQDHKQHMRSSNMGGHAHAH